MPIYDICRALLHDELPRKNASSVAFWERVLGFLPKVTSVTRNDQFPEIERLIYHVEAAKAESPGYEGLRGLQTSRSLRAPSNEFFDNHASAIWPNLCPPWLVDNPDRPVHSRHADR